MKAHNMELSKSEIQSRLDQMRKDLIYWQRKHERQKRDYTKLKVRELSEMVSR